MKLFKKVMRKIRNSNMEIKASHIIIAFLFVFGLSLYTISQRGGIKKSSSHSPTAFPAQVATYIIRADDEKELDEASNIYCTNKDCQSLSLTYRKDYSKKSFDDIDFFIINTQTLNTKTIQWLQKEVTASNALTKIVIGNSPQLPTQLQNTLCNSATYYVSTNSTLLADAGKVPNCSVHQLVVGTTTNTLTEPTTQNQFEYVGQGFLVIEVPYTSTEPTTYKFIDKNAQILYPSFEAF